MAIRNVEEFMKRNIAKAKDFDITETDVRLSGYCAECRQECCHVDIARNL